MNRRWWTWLGLAVSVSAVTVSGCSDGSFGSAPCTELTCRPCKKLTDCPSGAACVDGFCAQPCVSSFDCQRGDHACVGGICQPVESPSCASPSECGDTANDCSAGDCFCRYRPACEPTESCTTLGCECDTGGLACDGECITGITCCADIDCSPLKCIAGQCQCPTGFKACADGCVRESGCCESAECTGGQTCQGGQCLCPPGESLCNGACAAGGQECCINTDCGVGGVCELGACSCGTGFQQCAGSCIPDTLCCNDGDCAAPRVCASGFCDCPTGTVACDTGCIPIGTCCIDGDCGTGERCIGNACVCPGGQSSELTCDDGEDNDCDSRIDCADTSCEDRPCGPNGLACSTGACVCPGGTTETNCTDDVDDDCDGLVDCDDPNCSGEANCQCDPAAEGGPGTCFDGRDNDCDDAIDCDDPDCADQACGTPGAGPCDSDRLCAYDGGTQSGSCAIVFPGSETACEDGNPCTEGGQCNGSGGCGSNAAAGSCCGLNLACDGSGACDQVLSDTVNWGCDGGAGACTADVSYCSIDGVHARTSPDPAFTPCGNQCTGSDCTQSFCRTSSAICLGCGGGTPVCAAGGCVECVDESNCPACMTCNGNQCEAQSAGWACEFNTASGTCVVSEYYCAVGGCQWTTDPNVCTGGSNDSCQFDGCQGTSCQRNSCDGGTTTETECQSYADTLGTMDCACTSQGSEDCTNGWDDDCDGLVDCADTTDCEGQLCGGAGTGVCDPDQRCGGGSCVATYPGGETSCTPSGLCSTGTTCNGAGACGTPEPAGTCCGFNELCDSSGGCTGSQSDTITRGCNNTTGECWAAVWYCNNPATPVDRSSQNPEPSFGDCGNGCNPSTFTCNHTFCLDTTATCEGCQQADPSKPICAVGGCAECRVDANCPTCSTCEGTSCQPIPDGLSCSYNASAGTCVVQHHYCSGSGCQWTTDPTVCGSGCAFDGCQGTSCQKNYCANGGGTVATEAACQSYANSVAGSTGAPTTDCTCDGGSASENDCDDGFDNDCDGQVDCADANCSSDPACDPCPTVNCSQSACDGEPCSDSNYCTSGSTCNYATQTCGSPEPYGTCCGLNQLCDSSGGCTRSQSDTVDWGCNGSTGQCYAAVWYCSVDGIHSRSNPGGSAYSSCGNGCSGTTCNHNFCASDVDCPGCPGSTPFCTNGGCKECLGNNDCATCEECSPSGSCTAIPDGYQCYASGGQCYDLTYECNPASPSCGSGASCGTNCCQYNAPAGACALPDGYHDGTCP